jgi:hypothetical protein
VIGIASAFGLRATADKSLHPSYELRLKHDRHGLHAGDHANSAK